jgi:hypothetical protein
LQIIHTGTASLHSFGFHPVPVTNWTASFVLKILNIYHQTMLFTFTLTLALFGFDLPLQLHKEIYYSKTRTVTFKREHSVR